ncbi:hypothetical protein BV25DRAFT_1892643 [Artomyces pyxidatus]|uniref:Uncharacterized protein n=1 Tax=Artomyces pyxidatus TaxID=48021 RepID=A0ACB8SNX3_9AGAM|nr:hypothetical protein BV25DRAFT_1892643 [Artomyces pyxidatus]
MAMLETPSRIWRRIEAEEDHDMPSLPSLPAFEDSADNIATSTTEESQDEDISAPLQSTPALSSHTATSTIRLQASPSSTARFAQSLASRASRSTSAFSSSHSLKRSAATPVHHDSLSFDDVSAIPSLPGVHDSGMDEADMDLSGAAHEDGLEDLSMADALQSISRTSSPEPDSGRMQKKYDYSVSLKSEPKASPFDKMRHVSFRKPIPRMRTPSLTRTTPSPSSSSSNSTPHSTRSFIASRSPAVSPLAGLSIPLPPSNNASPTTRETLSNSEEEIVSQGDESAEELIQVLPEKDAPSVEPDMGDSVESREPTFSSEEAPTPRSHPPTLTPSPAPQSAFSSPAASIAFTPTPAFNPRPRARFLAPALPATPAQGHPDEEDPTTPYNRRRSFLMDVINSTTRPRMAQPTPHPIRAVQTPVALHMETPTPASGSSGSTNSSQDPSAAGRLQAAFAGVTPGPRPRVRTAGRLSHPLARGWTAGSESEEAGPSDAGSQSPYERASFISTASSHDLTAHVRANASFDPVMGLGAGGHGVGRFNASKLNSYLHGLNRRLQEESETLTGAVGALRRENAELDEQNGVLRAEMEALKEQMRSLGGRRGSAGRRVSDIGSTLGNVEEDVGGEGWMEEKAEMEDALDALRTELEKCAQEREDFAQTLEEERAERSRDKERWRERMGEVERGVEGIIHDLETKLQLAEAKANGADERDAEVRELERALEESERAKKYANERAEKAERMLENGRELGGELREANEKLGKALAELRGAEAHIHDLEDELNNTEHRASVSERDLKDERTRSHELARELEDRDARLSTLEEKLSIKEASLAQAERELQETKAYVTELETDTGAAVEHIEALQDEVNAAREKMDAIADDEEQTDQDFAKLHEDAERNAELARQLEEALQAAEQKMLADQGALAELRHKVAALEREKARVDPSRNLDEALDEAAEQIEALEKELDGANREIGRLNGVLAQSPARKAIDKARQAKIEILEKEKEELLERVQSMKGVVAGMSTPSKLANASGISPFHRQVLNMTMKTPKTPGAPLKDMSWLHPSISDPSTTPYLAEIQRLQQELDRANDSIDEKLDRLENAGFGVVELRQQLDDERARNINLEEDLARLERREERRLRRLEKARCMKCRSKVDLRGLNRAAEGDESSLDFSSASLLSEPPTPPSKTSEALKAELQSVNQQLTLMKKQWQEEKRQLLGDKAVLQDAANRLNLQVQSVRSGVQGDLDQAKQVISDLEEELRTERTRLRVLATEQNKAERDKENVLLQLRRTESDMDDVKRQLQSIKRSNNELEDELRVNATAEQKARLLEVKTAENAETIEQLRQERSLLIADHKKLQKRFKEASERMNKLRDEQAASQTSHDNRRHALDLQLLEIEDLKRALAERTDALQAAEAAQVRAASAHEREQEQERLVATLEADLTRVRRNAEALGRDLRAERKRREDENARREEERKKEKGKAGHAKKEVEDVRREMEKIERARKQAGAEVRVLRERVELLEHERNALQEQAEQTDEKQLVSLRAQHKLECKGLIVQIHYLKAKFTRENSLRDGLCYQKRYLLVLLSRYQRSEEKVLASIARIGFPVAPPPPTSQRRTLRTVALSLLFIQRARHASEAWRAQRASKPAVKAALENVRRNRKPTHTPTG